MQARNVALAFGRALRGSPTVRSARTPPTRSRYESPRRLCQRASTPRTGQTSPLPHDCAATGSTALREPATPSFSRAATPLNLRNDLGSHRRGSDLQSFPRRHWGLKLSKEGFQFRGLWNPLLHVVLTRSSAEFKGCGHRLDTYRVAAHPRSLYRNPWPTHKLRSANRCVLAPVRALTCPVTCNSLSSLILQAGTHDAKSSSRRSDRTDAPVA
jgi:hypothetical protein